MKNKNNYFQLLMNVGFLEFNEKIRYVYGLKIECIMKIIQFIKNKNL